jgi:hypothetical protein
MFAMKVAENFRNIQERLNTMKAEGKSPTKDDFEEALDDFGVTPSFGFEENTGKVVVG